MQWGMLKEWLSMYMYSIGMLIESMAGKSGSMNGVFQDATPFRFHEDRKVIDYLGEQLR